MRLVSDRPVRSLSRGALGWAFGLAVTIFLISMWGRAMVVDSETLAQSLSPLGSSAPVVDLLTEWIGEELVGNGADSGAVDNAVAVAVGHPDVAAALDRLVAEMVLAAAAPGPGEAVVDVGAFLRPVAGQIAEAVAGSTGTPVTPGDVVAVLDRLDPFVVRAEGAQPQIGPRSPIAGRLGTAAILAVVAAGLFGVGAVRLSDDRPLALKGLFIRVALGALSFAVLLRIGSWVVSPTGGRAPIASTMAALLHAKWMVPMTVALVAGVGVAVLWLIRRLRDQPAASVEPVPEDVGSSV